MDHIFGNKTEHAVLNRGVQVQVEEVIMTAACSIDRVRNAEF